jgi:hypothetical protein
VELDGGMGVGGGANVVLSRRSELKRWWLCNSNDLNYPVSGLPEAVAFSLQRIQRCVSASRLRNASCGFQFFSSPFYVPHNPQSCHGLPSQLRPRSNGEDFVLWMLAHTMYEAWLGT